ncbi:hypothetical protein ACJX0J_009839, partial [Zea mays]
NNLNEALVLVVPIVRVSNAIGDMFSKFYMQHFLKDYTKLATSQVRKEETTKFESLKYFDQRTSLRMALMGATKHDTITTLFLNRMQIQQIINLKMNFIKVEDKVKTWYNIIDLLTERVPLDSGIYKEASRFFYNGLCDKNIWEVYSLPKEDLDISILIMEKKKNLKLENFGANTNIASIVLLLTTLHFVNHDSRNIIITMVVGSEEDQSYMKRGINIGGWKGGSFADLNSLVFAYWYVIQYIHRLALGLCIGLNDLVCKLENMALDASWILLIDMILVTVYFLHILYAHDDRLADKEREQTKTKMKEKNKG